MDFAYICSECGRRFAIEPGLMVCPQCSQAQAPDQPLRGVLEVELTGTAPDNWTVASLLPVEPRFFPPIPVGNTPLWAPERLRQELAFAGVYIKDDGLNPGLALSTARPSHVGNGKADRVVGHGEIVVVVARGEFGGV